MRFALVAVPLFLLAGCTASAPSAVRSAETLHVGEAQVAPAASEPPAPSDAIVIDQRGSTEITAEGKAIATSDIERLAVGDRILTAQKQRKTGTFGCDIDFGNGPYHTDGEYEGQSLSFSDSNGESQLVEKLSEQEKQPNAVIEQTQRITITGIVGPYVFVRVAHGFFGCGGAHPFSGVEAFVWDAEHQKKVEFDAPADAKAAATADLKDRGTMDEVRFAEATPKFDSEGHLSIDWRFEKFTFYADSDGRGSAYTASAVASSVELPPQLRAFRDAPPSVLKYTAQTGEPILGWSRIVREPR